MAVGGENSFGRPRRNMVVGESPNASIGEPCEIKSVGMLELDAINMVTA